MNPAQGRVISLAFNLRLTPPQDEGLGTTDAAIEIGRRIVQETMLILRHKGEAAGFIVDVEARQVVI